jgi:hypothetical protein
MKRWRKKASYMEVWSCKRGKDSLEACRATERVSNKVVLVDTGTVKRCTYVPAVTTTLT